MEDGGLLLLLVYHNGVHHMALLIGHMLLHLNQMLALILQMLVMTVKQHL